jgi:hypothetical protein
MNRPGSVYAQRGAWKFHDPRHAPRPSMAMSDSLATNPTHDSAWRLNEAPCAGMSAAIFDGM